VFTEMLEILLKEGVGNVMKNNKMGM